MKVIIYGSEICGDCTDVLQRLKEISANDLQYYFIDITENVTNMKRFLKLRDTSDLFLDVREQHTIGIPFFQFDDGFCTLDVNAAYKKMGLTE